MLEKVTDTAKALMAFKAETDTIPYAKKIADYFNIDTPAALREDFGFQASVLHFEMRSRSLDYFLEKTSAPTVLELSAGFSLRGLEYAHHNINTTYLDTDLNSIITAKTGMLENMGETVPSNLQFLDLDALDEKSFPAVSSEVLIINEGLLMYFNRESQRRILRNIHSLLNKNGGTWVTADIYLKHETHTLGSDRDKKWNTFFKKNNVHENYFESFGQAEQFFNDNGFRIIEKYEPEFEKLSSLPKLLETGTPKQLELLKSKGRIQETWRLAMK
ncbi:class I SAM-dependent methyltransferase [Chryseobacterium gallinarum]|uniref:Class I SAM-dependent methyltransferase n=1 Tax=Chryseobacterium gallinarum TaxID=1324352 RepID=A0ABX6KPW3_CHRGL|nr:class I SAM-dependent methyltransferase [Chryseobacterium gallinarum]QIY89484.1 hypothetical protein FOB44_01920 [Chryseobacterium gallinarum]